MATTQMERNLLMPAILPQCRVLDLGLRPWGFPGRSRDSGRRPMDPQIEAKKSLEFAVAHKPYNRGLERVLYGMLHSLDCWRCLQQHM